MYVQMYIIMTNSPLATVCTRTLHVHGCIDALYEYIATLLACQKQQQHRSRVNAAISKTLTLTLTQAHTHEHRV